MMPLVYELWRDVMDYPASNEDKVTAICAVLHVYSSILGMTDEDFKSLAKHAVNTYPGPFPDGFSEQVVKYYEDICEQ